MKLRVIFSIILCIFVFQYSFADETKPVYPDYACEYLGNDKFETFNRKMFKFNTNLNKYAIRPAHKIWASIMPKYGMDRILSATENIEYPKRLMSCLIQRDFKTSGTETLRFLTNTTIGLGGLYDPAKRFFNLYPAGEDMDQALAKCGLRSGPYCVLPVIASVTPRGAAGKGLDAALNPSCYIASPILAIIKSVLVLNRTSYMQPFAQMIESNYADPYDITKKFYGIERYIKTENLDRKEFIETEIKLFEGENNEITAGDKTEEKLVNSNNLADGAESELYLRESVQEDEEITVQKPLVPDVLLEGYNPQGPVIDSLRTALFEIPGINESIWSELSIWNRCFANRIKMSSINIVPGRDNYKFRYILNKDRTSPLAIIFPSTGEGITSHHSVCLAKIFYDSGYSVLIMGSHFQWEFVNSMPESYHPGIPLNDSDYLRMTVSKIVNKLEDKYERKFKNNILIGTSFGAVTCLFIADKEAENNTLGIVKYISVCPPIDLLYAMKQVDKIHRDWCNNTADLKDRVGITAAKILKLTEDTKEHNVSDDIEYLPFSDDEACMITSFIMHQKMSDLIYTLEKNSTAKKTDLYSEINNMGYEEYANKYLLNDEYKTIDDFSYNASLYSLGSYLANNNNYKIYHSIDDYLVTPEQLSAIKSISGKNMTLLSNGAHLGFLYRKEFQDSLKDEIKRMPELMNNETN